jgi:hypothetical protein
MSVQDEKSLGRNELLTERQVVDEIFSGLISVRTIQTWRQQGRGPQYVRIGRRIVHRRGDVLDYLKRCSIQTEEPPVSADEVLNGKC